MLGFVKSSLHCLNLTLDDAVVIANRSKQDSNFQNYSSHRIFASCSLYVKGFTHSSIHLLTINRLVGIAALGVLERYVSFSADILEHQKTPQVIQQALLGSYAEFFKLLDLIPHSVSLSIRLFLSFFRCSVTPARKQAGAEFRQRYFGFSELV
jgi:hypothetical protein